MRALNLLGDSVLAYLKKVDSYVRFFVAVVLLTSLMACGKPESGQVKKSESEKLESIISIYTANAKRLDPFYASTYNLEDDLDKFGDYPSPTYFARARALYQNTKESLDLVIPTQLSEKDLRTYALFKDDIENALESFSFPTEFLEFNQMGNRLRSYSDDANPNLTSFPFDTVRHYEAFVKRSEGFSAYVENQIALLREGVRRGITLSCIVAKETPNSYKDALEPEVEKNPFWQPITVIPDSFSNQDRENLKRQFRIMIRARILPGYQRFDRFFREEYQPHCRNEFGLYGLPEAKSWYAHFIKANTNLAMNPEEIHRIGLQEVDRISRGITEIQKELGFKGTRQDFLHSLLSDPQYFFSSKEDMFAAFTSVKEETAKVIPRYFNLIPQTDFKIVESSNPEDAAGAYQDPTEMVPYGRFIVNTQNLRAVPKYEVTTLMLHETVPGHHFQLALQFELKNELSEYQRKLYMSNAFVEGWALYSEYLGNEMGLFKDPLQRLGHLNDEMLRAVRLVVDTGIHAKGWSQEKVREYMSEYLANDSQDIEVEANRYSVWPGQALGYKLGQLKILELRRLAEEKLGEKFNLPEFHRVVIGSGTVSLTVLESQVKAWIASAAKASLQK